MNLGGVVKTSWAGGHKYDLLLLLQDLFRANFEDRVRGAGVARWRTWL